MTSANGGYEEALFYAVQNGGDVNNLYKAGNGMWGVQNIRLPQTGHVGSIIPLIAPGYGPGYGSDHILGAAPAPQNLTIAQNIVKNANDFGRGVARATNLAGQGLAGTGDNLGKAIGGVEKGVLAPVEDAAKKGFTGLLIGVGIVALVLVVLAAVLSRPGASRSIAAARGGTPSV